MAVTREDDKPWKTDLARKSAQRREQVLHELEEVIQKASSFEAASKFLPPTVFGSSITRTFTPRFAAPASVAITPRSWSW